MLLASRHFYDNYEMIIGPCLGWTNDKLPASKSFRNVVEAKIWAKYIRLNAINEIYLNIHVVLVLQGKYTPLVDWWCCACTASTGVGRRLKSPLKTLDG